MFRLRYTPLGWSKKYEFNESDLKCACDTIDRWIDDTAKGNCSKYWENYTIIITIADWFKFMLQWTNIYTSTILLSLMQTELEQLFSTRR